MSLQLMQRMGIHSAENRADRPTFESLTEAVEVQAWETLPAAQQASLAQAIAPDVTVSGVAYPGTPAALATLVQADDRQPLLPCGVGSKLAWGGLVGGLRDEGRGLKDEEKTLPLLVVSTERLKRLIDHAIGDLTVTVEAGMRFADVQATLATAGQYLPIDPAYPDHATIGGIIATADTGSLRQRYNGVRDLLLGVSIVRADGQVAKAGGRVVKNVAGYDLMKLFTGSYGTLGIITQATLRVYPLPEASETVVLSGEAAAIAHATQMLLSSSLTPASADLLSESLAAAMDVGKGTALAVRFQSMMPSVQEQTNRMVELSKALGLAIASFSGTDDTALWQRLRERLTEAPPIDAITCKIGIRPSATVALLAMLTKHHNELTIAPQSGQLPSGHSGHVPSAQIHAASGLGRLLLDAATPPETLLNIRSCCQENGGFLSILQAPVALKQAIDVWGYNGNALYLMRQLKQQFDPSNRLSPHRFVGGI
ncbi:MAG TPA: FAD-binding oxidoreductase [Candidatus Sericytochromatia bacterium]